MSNLTIANTILNQIGGTRRLNVMTGAKDFMAIENGVQFRIGKNSKSVNIVRVVLNALDLYDVEFGQIRKVKGIPTYIVRSSVNDIYNDMLKGAIENGTGMYLSF